MIDSGKLDSFFDSSRSLDFDYSGAKKRGIDWRRLFKIVLPCIAAALLGVMVVMPNIKKSVDLSENVTLPKKGEMEKLHIEQTVFNTIDSKNRVNKLFADNVDETEAGSQIYKIINPKAIIPTDNGHTDVTSDIGYFDQNSNVLQLEKNVKAVVDEDTVITTLRANYDFKQEKGWGTDPVFAKGSWGDMQAEAFDYDKIAQILVLKGNNRITTDKGILTAKEETRIYQAENKSVAVGDALITQNTDKLYAEEIVGWFSNSSKKELERAEAYRNVRMETPKEIIIGNEAYYDALQGKIEVYGYTRKQCRKESSVKIRQGENDLSACEITAYVSNDGRNELQKVIAVGDVEVQTPTENIVGEKGIYEPNRGKITMFGGKQPVVINKEDKVLRAQKVVAHLDKQRNLQYAEAFGDVEVVTPKGSAWGDRGVYNPQEQKVELFENVRLEQNGNFITGAYAVTDLATSVSRIIGNETTGGRIRGTFYKKRK